MLSESLMVKGNKMKFRQEGKGQAVVLLHGFGEDGTVWENQYHAFDGYHVIIPDLPGSGGSDLISDMSMEGLAKSVYDFLNQLQIKKCIMIGHSMGGYVLLAFAEKYPEMLTAFGLFHSTAFPDSEEKKDIRKKGIAFIQKNGSFEFLKTSIPGLFSDRTKQKNPGLIEEQIKLSHNFSDAALVSYYMSMMERPDRTEILRTTRLPVLFILGKYDNAVPLADGLRLCHLPELSYIHILDQSAHMGMKEEPDLSNILVQEFLKSTSHQTR
jgi:pimeloyl-ACP methyl ester carboxylesterase